MFLQSATLLTLVASVSAHVIIQNPAPFKFENTDTKLSPLGIADFPCKMPQGTYEATQMNQWNAGETQGVSFMGGTTHGGGSCQFSLTTDTKPTKDSQWKVIQSNIGNCPGGPPDANANGSPTYTGLAPIDVTMPSDIPSGQYTFAWTWINKLGVREFYMNCAPIQVGSSTTASADAASVLGKLPDMFVINLPNDQCASKEMSDFDFPEPGNNVVRAPGAVASSETTGGSCPAVQALGAGKGSLGTPSQAYVANDPSEASGYAPGPIQSQAAPSAAAPSGGAPASSAAPAPAPSQAAPSAAVSSAAAPAYSPAPAPSQAAPSSAAPPPAAVPSAMPAPPTNGSSNGDAYAPAAPAPSPAAPAPSAGTTGNARPADCTPCTKDGAVVCIGTNQFGLCNRGCAVPQEMAAGMACTNGVMAAAVKRHVHFPRAHLRRLSH